LGVPKDSNPNFFQVLGFTPTLGQSRVATKNETFKVISRNNTKAKEVEI
jgi:hypothetical protein